MTLGYFGVGFLGGTEAPPGAGAFISTSYPADA